MTDEVVLGASSPVLLNGKTGGSSRAVARHDARGWKGTPRMRHRHLDEPGYSLTAIDDVIERGSLQDWIEMAEAADNSGAVLDRIRTIVSARTGDQSTIHHDFWRVYLASRRG